MRSEYLQKNLKKAKKIQGIKEKNPPSTPLVPADPHSRAVFKKVTPAGELHLGLAFIIIPAALFLSVIVLDSTYLPYVFGAYGFVLICHLIVNRFRYHFLFRGWEKKLPFELLGWEQLIAAKRIYCDLCWTDISLKVLPDEKNQNINPYSKAALEIFCRRANKAFYDRKMGAEGMDKRINWSVTDDLSAKGSASPKVLKHLKTALQKDLSTVARETKGIKKIEIAIHSDEYVEPIEIPTSEGTAS